MAREILITGERSGRQFVRKTRVHGSEAYFATEKGKPYVLKFPNIIGDTASTARLEMEAEYQQMFAYPRITPVVLFDITHDLLEPDIPFMVMPRAQTDLSRYMRRRKSPLPIEKTLTISEHVSDGLATMHSAGILQGDLDPLNILLHGIGSDTSAQIADFGEAVALEDAHRIPIFPKQYPFPPEKYQGVYIPETEQTDLAMKIIYPMVVGTEKSPFPHTMSSTVEYSASDRQSFESLLPPNAMTIFHEALETVVETAMRDEPSDRYPSMAALHDDLRTRREIAKEVWDKHRRHFDMAAA